MNHLRGEPAQPSVRRIRVVVVDGPDRAAEAIGDRVAIGTSPDNQLVLTDPTVSQYHAEVRCEGRCEDGVLVNDLGSRTGTFASDIQLREAAVPLGSRLRLGKTVIVVTQAPAELPGPAPPIPQYRTARAAALAAFERRYLHDLIQATGGNASAAARAANMDRPYLLSLLRRHGLR